MFRLVKSCRYNDSTERRQILGKTEFIEDIKRGHIPPHVIVKSALNDPSIGNMLDNWPIKYACEKGDEKLVKLLLNNAVVNPCCDNYRPLKIAFLKGNDKILHVLMLDKRIYEKFALILVNKSTYQDDSFLSWLPDDIIGEIMKKISLLLLIDGNK
jgi:hypothetical protein